MRDVEVTSYKLNNDNKPFLNDWQAALIVGIVIKYSATNLQKKVFYKIISTGLLKYKFPVLFWHNVYVCTSTFENSLLPQKSTQNVR